MDKDQEVALVAGCQKGNRQALEALVRQFEKPVFNAAYRMLGNADEAADVTQATFLKVMENVGRFDPKFRLFSWIYRIAINEAIDHLKRRERSGYLDEPACPDMLEDGLTALQLSEQVQVVLMELNEDLRTVITLRYFTECSYRQIGEILSLPEKTVRSRLFTARQQLKSRLEQHRIWGQ